MALNNEQEIGEWIFLGYCWGSQWEKDSGLYLKAIYFVSWIDGVSEEPCNSFDGQEWRGSWCIARFRPMNKATNNCQWVEIKAVKFVDSRFKERGWNLFGKLFRLAGDA